MKELSKLLMRNFLPVFLGALSFFTILIDASDLIINIVKYMQRDVPFSTVLYIQLLYLPTSFTYALPISLLFSVSYSMGTLHANNELIAVFASGISLKRFIVPLVVTGIFLSVFLFVVQNQLAIPMLKEKDDLSTQVLRNRPSNLNRSNINIQSRKGQVVYTADFYDDRQKQLENVQVIIRDENMRIALQVDADWAAWDGSAWQLHSVSLLRRVPPAPDVSAGGGNTSLGDLNISKLDQWSDPRIDLPPESFQNQYGDIDQMGLSEARGYLKYLREGGFPYRKELTRYHERYSFSFTPLIVTLLSAGIGGAFRKNILAMSLLVSLGLSIVYYSVQMLSGLFATLGYLNSIAGAWMGTLLTAAAAAYIVHRAKT